MRLSPVTPQQTKGRLMTKLQNYISKSDSSVPLLLSVCKWSRYSVQI